MRLENRVAIITGAGRGIGRSIALAYAKEGAKISLASRTLSELEETARLAGELGAETMVIPTDVSEQVQVEEMARQTLDRFSTIDILVNNAAVLGPIGPLQDKEVSDWIRTIQVNVIGTYLCCRTALPVMLRQGGGKIINVTSGFISQSFVYRHMDAYFSSKAAVTQFTELLAQQLAGENIYVNALHPGGDTKGLKELGDAARKIGDDELLERVQRVITTNPSDRSGELAVFLGSEASGTLSGRLVRVGDDFADLPSRIPGIMASDAYTLRRVELE